MSNLMKVLFRVKDPRRQLPEGPPILNINALPSAADTPCPSTIEFVVMSEEHNIEYATICATILYQCPGVDAVDGGHTAYANFIDTESYPHFRFIHTLHERLGATRRLTRGSEESPMASLIIYRDRESKTGAIRVVMGVIVPNQTLLVWLHHYVFHCPTGLAGSWLLIRAQTYLPVGADPVWPDSRYEPELESLTKNAKMATMGKTASLATARIRPFAYLVLRHRLWDVGAEEHWLVEAGGRNRGEMPVVLQGHRSAGVNTGANIAFNMRQELHTARRDLELWRSAVRTPELLP